MSSSNSCGCCTGIVEQTPQFIGNRPELPKIAYRIGTHSQFMASMEGSLSNPTYSALRSLTTRETDDFAIGLIDTASVLMDILTFYQERIANEDYLLTAVQMRSLHELARLTGYAPRPGVAANCFLAFTLDESASAPPEVDISVGLKVQSVPGPGEKPQNFETIEKLEARPELNRLRLRGMQDQDLEKGMVELYLLGDDLDLKPGDAILIVGDERASPSPSDWGRWEFRIVDTVTVDHERKLTRVTWKDGGGKSAPNLPSKKPVAYVFRQHASLFGHQAPDPRVLKLTDPTLVGSNNEWLHFEIQHGQIDLDSYNPRIVTGGWIVLARGMSHQRGAAAESELYRVQGVTSPSRTDFALSGKITRITPDRTIHLGGFEIRPTTVFAQSELLNISREKPVLDILVPAGTTTIVLDGEFEGLEGRLLAIDDSTSTNDSIGEVSSVSSSRSVATASGLKTQVTLSSPLSRDYVRKSFRINANVAKATHGETVQEILGSGDASKPFQTFILRQPPLTYVHSSSPSGTSSTLQVQINGLSWQEVSSLYGQDSKAHVFTARTSDRGTILEFGLMGARLPTGNLNVQAQYRKGIGLEGQVKRNQLTTLLTRPLSLKSVLNPLDATDAANPDPASDIRYRVPLRALTLDRAVSLDDYQSFSSTFAQVAKALATWTWYRSSRQILLTVAGPKGASVSDGTASQLVDALHTKGDPFVPVVVKSFRPITFHVSATLVIRPEFEEADVLTAAANTLAEKFGFDARSFGQPIFLSEVMMTLQSCTGIEGVEIRELYKTGDQMRGLHDRLEASLPTAGAQGDFVPAELLMIEPAPQEFAVSK